MIIRAVKNLLIAGFAAAALVPASAQNASAQSGPSAPAGWSDRQDGDIRILSKNGVDIEVSPWQGTGGQSVRDWLKSQERRGSGGAKYISTEKLQPERAIPGSYSLQRTIEVNGQSLTSILYACPGKSESVRLMELRAAVTRQNARDIVRAAQFGEEVCQSDPNMASGPMRPADRAQTASTASNPASLADANAQIPAANRPQSARVVLKDKWVGFPAVLVSEASAEMYFANGYATSCAKWNPLTQSPTPASAGRIKRCDVKRGTNDGRPARKFRAGETLDITFGRIGGASFSDTATLSGKKLRMTSDGRIQIGEFTSFSSSRAAGGNRKISLTGRYYLNGHTITIRDARGRIYHGFIAASSNSGSSQIDHIFINGEHYWNRDD